MGPACHGGRETTSIRFFLWGLLLLSTGLFAQSSKISPDLTALLNNPNAPRDARVVVQFDLSRWTDGGELARGILGQTDAVFDLIPAASKSMPLRAIRGLANNPNVAYVSLDRPVAGALAGASDYSHLAVGADIAAGYGLTGVGVGVAILDSGISAHPDLASSVVYRESFVGRAGGRRITSIAGVTSDDYGHGTHVAGVVAGERRIVAARRCMAWRRAQCWWTCRCSMPTG